MPSYDDLSELKTELIRKTIGGSVFVAEATAAAITTLTSATGTAPNQVISLTALDPAYSDLGYLTDDGAQFSTETTESQITSFQSATATRSDITGETSTMTVTAQETKLMTLGLYTGAAMSGIIAAALTGEVKISKPERPSSRFYRVLALAIDETENGDIYIARYLPRAKVTGKGEQSYSKTDQALVWPVTFTGFKDSAGHRRAALLRRTRLAGPPRRDGHRAGRLISNYRARRDAVGVTASPGTSLTPRSRRPTVARKTSTRTSTASTTDFGVFTRGGETRAATSAADAVKLQFDGFRPAGIEVAPAPADVDQPTE